MKTIHPCSLRLTALFLAGALALPTPAQALRPAQTVDAGLEAELQSRLTDIPAGGLEANGQETAEVETIRLESLRAAIAFQIDQDIMGQHPEDAEIPGEALVGDDISAGLNLDQLRRLRVLMVPDDMQPPANLADAIPVDPAHLVSSLRAARNFQLAMDPAHPDFDHRHWVELVYQFILAELSDGLESGEAGMQDLIFFWDRGIRPVNPSFDIRAEMGLETFADRLLTRVDLMQFVRVVRERFMLPGGFYCHFLEGDDSSLVFGRVVSVIRDLATPQGRSVPVYVVRSEEGTVPSAFASPDVIVVAEERVLDFRNAHAFIYRPIWEMFQARFSDWAAHLDSGALLQWWSQEVTPRLSGTVYYRPPYADQLESPEQFLLSFLYLFPRVFAYGRHESVEEGLSVFLQDSLLAEELAHVDTLTRLQALLSMNPTVVQRLDPERYLAAVRSMRRTETALHGALLADEAQPIAERLLEADALLELEARYQALEHAPNPSVTLQEFIAKEVFLHAFMEPEHERAQDWLLSDLSQALTQGRLQTGADWRQNYLVGAVAQMDRFQAVLRATGVALRQREILPHDQWTLDAAGLEGQVLVLERPALAAYAPPEQFVERLPWRGKAVLFDPDQESLVDLAVRLAGLEHSDRVQFFGRQELADGLQATLSRISTGMRVTRIPPSAGLRGILAAIFPAEVLDQIQAGMEQVLQKAA